MKHKRRLEDTQKPKQDAMLDDQIRELLHRSSNAVPTPSRSSTQIEPVAKRPWLRSLSFGVAMVGVLIGVGKNQFNRNQEQRTVIDVLAEPTTLPETMLQMPQVTDAQGKVIDSALPKLFAAAAAKCIPILASSELNDPNTWIATTLPFAIMNINPKGVSAEQFIRVPSAIYDLSVTPSQPLPDTPPPAQQPSETGIALLPNRFINTKDASLSIGPIAADSVVGGATVVDIDAWDGTTWIPVARAQVNLTLPTALQANEPLKRRCPTAWFDPKKIETLPNKFVNLTLEFKGFSPQGSPPMLNYYLDLPRLVKGWYRATTVSPIATTEETLQTTFRVG